MYLSSNLQHLRRKSDGMTQEKLAQRMGVSRQTISKWESGEAYPEIGNLLELCDIFSCSLDALLREDMTVVRPSPVRLVRVPRFRMAQYIILSRNARKDVLAYMAQWAEENGLQNCSRIHWGFPYVSVEQKRRFGLQGHGAACILSEDFSAECEDVQILDQKEAVYAVMTLRADDDGVFPESSRVYPVIMEYLADNGIRKSMEEGVLPGFEREYQKNGVAYKDVFVLCQGKPSEEFYRL